MGFGDDPVTHQSLGGLVVEGLHRDHRVDVLPVVQAAVHPQAVVLVFCGVQGLLDVGFQLAGVPLEEEFQHSGAVGGGHGAVEQDQGGGKQKGKTQFPFHMGLLGAGLTIQSGVHPGQNGCFVQLGVFLRQVQLLPQLMDVAWHRVRLLPWSAVL